MSDEQVEVEVLENVLTTQDIIANAKKEPGVIAYNFTGVGRDGKDAPGAVVYNRDASAKGINDKSILK